MTIRCLIVDDEPLGRERVVSLLRALPDAEVVGECADGASAIESISALAPDLLFLDVQMPEVDGFGVLAAIPRTRPLEVIFVTAYEQYAIKAFEVHAQDYLLKPFDPDRFYSAFQRAASRIRGDGSRGAHPSLTALVNEMTRRTGQRTRLPIKSDGRVFLLEVADIDWLESHDNHVKVHAAGATHLVRQTLQALEASLPAEFVRVHRSAIVNVARIREIQPWFNGEHVLLLHGGSKVHTSRGYRARVEELMR